MRLRTGSKRLIREINEALVLDTVRLERSVSRAFISEATGLSPATVTGITGKLISTGYLVESEAQRGTGGRPAQLLSLATDRILVIGVRLSNTVAYATTIDLSGDVQSTHSEPWSGARVEDAVDAIASAIDALVSRARPEQTVIGAGVAVSGIVDHQRGIVRHSGSLGWQDVPLHDLLADRLSLPVKVDNYVNAFALGLLLFGSGLASHDALVVNVGTSIGMSLVLGGRMYRGAHGTAGGLAHSRIGLPRDTSRPCHCGALGCLETWSSLWGINSELVRRGLLVDSDALAARRNEPGIAEVLAEAASALSAALANAAKQFGPHTVLVSLAAELRFSEFEGAIIDQFRSEFDHDQMGAPHLEIVTADDTAWARGAGCEILAGLFKVDVESDSSVDAAVV